MNTQQMMEEIDRLARLCEAKDAEIAFLQNCQHTSRITLRDVQVEFNKQLSSMTQRAEAAEARIKASQEQEPFMWITSSGMRIPDKNVQREIAIANGWIACYAAPVITPDVAELQRAHKE